METINYRDRNYRVQNANGWKHIIVTENGIKQRIGVNKVNVSKEENKPDIVHQYIFGGLFETHPCPALEFWIYRHRMGNRISVYDYMVKFKVNKKSVN